MQKFANNFKEVILLKRYGGNSSSIGTASHIEKHFPTKRTSQTSRRLRSKCVYYCSVSKRCNKLEIACVGPSNELCNGNYKEDKPIRNTIEIGTLVKSSQYGVGMVMNTYNQRFFEVKYHNSNFLKKYTLQEIKQILLK